MKNTPFLRKQIDLLLDSFGEDAVVSALLERKGMSRDNDSPLAPDRQSSKKRKRGLTAVEVIERFATQHPDRSDDIRSFGYRFENRSFLPAMKDVNRFLGKYAEPGTRIESRLKALPKVLSILVGLDSSEVRKLLDAEAHPRASSFSIISDAILSRD